MVRLEVIVEDAVKSSKPNFNSCMVRLEGGTFYWSYEMLLYFNSCMVRLEV